MLSLELIKEPTEKVYESLIDYTCLNNDIITFEVITYDINKEERKREFEIICKSLDKKEIEMIKSYNDKTLLDKLYELLKDKRNMSWDAEVSKIKKISEKYGKIQFEDIKKSIIQREIESLMSSEIGAIIFQQKFNDLRENLEKDLIKIEYEKRQDKKEIFTDKYYYKISNTVRSNLLKYNSLYSLRFPNCFENISFIKGRNIWLETISHENLCFIYPVDKNEIEHLRRMGLQFNIIEE